MVTAMMYEIVYLVPTAMGSQQEHVYRTRDSGEAARVVTKCKEFGYEVISVERKEVLV